MTCKGASRRPSACSASRSSAATTPRGCDTTSPLLVSILRQGDYLLASINAALDDGEMLRFQESLVERIGDERARGVIVDVAALDVLDSFGARTLGTLAEIARLRGAETVIVGVRPEIAFAMVRLGMSIPHVHTALDLEQGLQLLDGLTHGRPSS